MNWLPVAIALIKIVSYIVQRISVTEGMKKQLADELIELEGRIENTKKIIADVKSKDEAEIDSELRK